LIAASGCTLTGGTDYITTGAPATPDATLANICISLHGTRQGMAHRYWRLLAVAGNGDTNAMVWSCVQLQTERTTRQPEPLSQVALPA
jgi:hypothetical protein